MVLVTVLDYATKFGLDWWRVLPCPMLVMKVWVIQLRIKQCPSLQYTYFTDTITVAASCIATGTNIASESSSSTTSRALPRLHEVLHTTVYHQSG